jgi:hypothetical protein
MSLLSRMISFGHNDDGQLRYEVKIPYVQHDTDPRPVYTITVTGIGKRVYVYPTISAGLYSLNVDPAAARNLAKALIEAADAVENESAQQGHNP